MIDHSSQIGPMILIDARIVTVGKKRLCCPDKQCVRYWKKTKENFCSTCGKEIMEHHYEVEEVLTWWDFVQSMYSEEDDGAKEEEYENLFICPDYLGTADKIVLLPNLTRASRHLEENDFVVLSDGTLDIGSKLREFKDENMEHIQLIKDFFGQGNVSVEYAVCRYTM